MSYHQEKIDVEFFIDGFIQSVGGTRVDEILPREVSFNNADYMVGFAEHLIELKCLDENQIENSQFLKRIFNLHKGHLEYLNSDEASNKSAQTLALETMGRFKVDLERAMYSRIKKVITKANKQLRETKKHLLLPSYTGTVWIVNDNNVDLTVESQIELVSRVLQGNDYSNVDSVILSNINMPVADDEQVPSLYWIPIFRESSNEKVWQFTHYLGHCWQLYLQEKLELPRALDGIKNTENQSMDYLFNLKNIRV